MNKFIHLFLFVAFTGYCFSQVPVVIAPEPHPQFFNASGTPLAGGFLYTYAAGTTTFLNTYVDAFGIIQNPDPIPLDASGAPSNGSVQTGIWLANASYKFCAYDVNLVQQWCADNLSGYLGLLNQANAWTFAQTFTLPITDLSTDSQFVLGAVGNQTTLDFPPPSGNIVLHFPNTADTIPGRATTDTLSNKTLLLPLFNASTCPIVNGPATYVCLANASSTGTTLNKLAKFINAPSQAVNTAITDLNGIQGICVASCGTTGNATIQQNGATSCQFDGATTANDYFINSVTVAGDCHDSGSLTPVANSLGQVQSTNLSNGTYGVVLSTVAIGPRTVFTGTNNTALNTSTTSTQIQTQLVSSFQAGVLNTLGKAFRISFTGNVAPASSINSSAFVGFGTGSGLGTYQGIATETASGAAMNFSTIVHCVVSATGVSGSLNCGPVISSTGTTASSAGTFAINTDLTQTLFFGPACSFSGASASNTCTFYDLIAEQLN